MMISKLTSVFFLFLSFYSIKEYYSYIKEYKYFKKVGILKNGKVVSIFNGVSKSFPFNLPIRSLPIIEIETKTNNKRLKTFQNFNSPTSTFTYIGKKVQVLVDENNNDYCMIESKIGIVLGAIFNILFILGFILLLLF